MTEIKGACPHHGTNTNGSDSYCFNTEKGQGFCNSCGLSTWTDEHGRLWGRPNKQKKAVLIEGDYDVAEEEEYMVEDNPNLPTGEYEYVESRGIKKDIKEFFDIRTYRQVEWKAQNPKTKQWESGVSDEEHAIYPNGAVKIRRLDLPKDHFAHFAARGTLDCFFGQNLFPANCSRKLTIVEGDHYDTPSAYQMLRNSKFINPVVSVPSAKPSGRFWENTRKYLESFDELILSVDNDEAGSNISDVMFDLFPGKVYVVNHGDLKDASDFLQAGRQSDYSSAWWAKKKYSPAGFTAGVDSWLQALDEESPYTYTPTPIEGFNQVGRGIVKGGITVLKAPPGSGKSSLLRYLQYDQTVNHKCRVAVLMMEEVKSITGRAMATQALGKNVMTKEDAEWNGVSEDEVKEALKSIVEDDRFVSFEINPQDPITDTLEKCKQAVLFYGVDYIYIDHLQRLAYLAGTDSATANLTQLGVNLTEFSKRKNIGIVAISHVNEDGHTKYAKAIEEEAIVLIELSRDKEADDFDERNTSYLTVSKNRPFGTTGPAGSLTYDPETTILVERKGPKEPKTPNRKDF